MIKNKFEFIQEKHFTVPGLVGDNIKYPYSYIGEFLAETHQKNKELFDKLEAVTKQTNDKLFKLDEFVNDSVQRNLPN
jgi:uncharacterized lipoprotein YehR (DUF1307 family)